MVVTLKTVAKKAGVSVATVSHILGTRAHLFSQETRDRVLETAAQLGYRPNSAARAMRQRRAGAVAVLVTDYEHLPHRMLNAIEQVMSDANIHVSSVWIPPGTNGADTPHIPRILSEHMVDGYLMPWDVLPMVKSIVGMNRTPAVCVNVKLPCDCVYCDETVGTAAATAHLIKLGHRRIAYADYSAYPHYSGKDRQDGYLQAMRTARLPPRVIRESIVHHPARLARSREWLDAADRPTAVVTLSPTTALPILLAATMLVGLKVPADLSLVTVSNQLHDTTGLSIATVVEPEQEVGTAAAHMLLEKIADRQLHLPPRTFPAHFFPGETCAPPA